MFLSLADPVRVEPLFAALERWAELDGEDPWGAADAARLAAVRADRAAAAERYFAAHAGDWDEIRSLHIAESEVEAACAPGARASARSAAWSTSAPAPAGCSNCSAPPPSAPSASTARPRCSASPGSSSPRPASPPPSFARATCMRLPLAAGSADTVILHQVLHYAQQPAAAVAEAARLLAPGGRLLIVDFAPHEREELRSRDAHVRLGFADEVDAQISRRRRPSTAGSSSISRAAS